MQYAMPLTGIRDYSTSVLSLTYTMKDGSQVSRSYALNVASHIDTVRKILSHPEFVFGEILELWDQAWGRVTVETPESSDIHLSREQWAELKEVLLLDCQVGTMAQYYAVQEQSPVYHFYIRYREDDPLTHYIYYNIAVYPDAKNTIAWLEQQDFFGEYSEK